MISLNDRIELEITDMTEEGEGIGRYEGMAYFVDGAVYGDRVEAAVTQLKKTYAKAKAMKIIKPSEFRTKPECKHYERCGGCQLMDLTYEGQLKLKHKVVTDALERIAKIESPTIKQVIGMDQPKNYRNKSSMPVYKSMIGYYMIRSHKIVQIDECLIHDEAFNDTLRTVKNLLKQYDTSQIRHVVFRVSKSTREMMLILVTPYAPSKEIRKIASEIMENHSEIKSVFHNQNDLNSSEILGRKFKLIAGKDCIVDEIGGYKFMISPNSFFQINNIQTQKLYDKALEYASLEGGETVFDLYCGIGTIAMFLSSKASKVYGIESVKEAVEDARENVKLNNVENIEFIHGKAEEQVFELLEKGIRPDVVVVDPPRKGLEPELIEALIKLSPKKIVYVSCKPSTLARDLNVFTQSGYEFIEATPVDLFPNTMHVECITRLVRKDLV